MTELKGSATVTRKVQATDRHGRQIVVTLHAHHIEVRPFGTRERYTLSYQAVLAEAASREAERLRAERRARRRNDFLK